MRRPWFPEFIEFGSEKVCRIPLSRGLFALINPRHLAAVESYAWCARAYRNREGLIYAQTNVRTPEGRLVLTLHQLIWELLGNEGPVDHKNGDGLDCRDHNLRSGPHDLNAANSRKQVRPLSSRFKGVSWETRRSKWRVCLMLGGRYKHLGYFADEEQAARAYDAEALLAFGSYARLNFT